MTDYKKGLIYTLRSPHTDNIYIGSTCQRLSKRLYSHRRKYNAYKKGADAYVTSYKILEFGDDYIELLEAYPCNSRIELHKREGELIREHRDVCVNKCIAGRTGKQYYCENKEKIQEYYQENKEKVLKRAKEYREENKEKIKEQYQDNKQRLNERKKEKHDCECGGHYTLDHKARHKKTKIHLFIVNKLLI